MRDGCLEKLNNLLKREGHLAFQALIFLVIIGQTQQCLPVGGRFLQSVV